MWTNPPVAGPSAEELESKSHLPLEIPLHRSGLAENRRALGQDLAERRRGAADSEIGSRKLRMIQDVRGIHPDRQHFGLGETERFRDVPIQEPRAERIYIAVAERSNFSRFR